MSRYVSDIYAARYLGTRARQEDFVAGGSLASGGVFLILADGMGGHSDGNVASETAATAAAAALERGAAPVAAARAANHALAELKGKGSLAPNAGCTLIIATVHNGLCRWVSIGDSYLLCQKAGQQLERINPLHTYGARLDAMAGRGEISVEAAQSDPKRAALTSAVMGDDIEECSDGELMLDCGDRLILASDGYLTMGPELLGSFLSAHPAQGRGDAQMIATTILETVKRAGRPKQDNTSVVVYELAPAAPVTPAAAPQSFPARRLIASACALILLLIGLIAGLLWIPTEDSGNVVLNSTPDSIKMGNINVEQNELVTEPVSAPDDSVIIEALKKESVSETDVRTELINRLNTLQVKMADGTQVNSNETLQAYLKEKTNIRDAVIGNLQSHIMSATSTDEYCIWLKGCFKEDEQTQQTEQWKVLNNALNELNSTQTLTASNDSVIIEALKKKLDSKTDVRTELINRLNTLQVKMADGTQVNSNETLQAYLKEKTNIRDAIIGNLQSHIMSATSTDEYCIWLKGCFKENEQTQQTEQWKVLNNALNELYSTQTLTAPDDSVIIEALKKKLDSKTDVRTELINRLNTLQVKMADGTQVNSNKTLQAYLKEKTNIRDAIINILVQQCVSKNTKKDDPCLSFDGEYCQWLWNCYEQGEKRDGLESKARDHFFSLFTSSNNSGTFLVSYNLKGNSQNSEENSALQIKITNDGQKYIIFKKAKQSILKDKMINKIFKASFKQF